MRESIGPRRVLAGAGAAVLLGGLDGCVTAFGAKRPAGAGLFYSPVGST